MALQWHLCFETFSSHQATLAKWFHSWPRNLFLCTQKKISFLLFSFCVHEKRFLPKNVTTWPKRYNENNRAWNTNVRAIVQVSSYIRQDKFNYWHTVVTYNATPVKCQFLPYHVYWNVCCNEVCIPLVTSTICFSLLNLTCGKPTTYLQLYHLAIMRLVTGSFQILMLKKSELLHTVSFLE